MATLLEQLAEQLAKDAMAQAERDGNDQIIDDISKNLADTSTTFQENYLTCIRYLRADLRARVLFPENQAATALPPPDDEPSRPASRPTPAEEEPTAEPTDVPEPSMVDASTDDEEIPYAEAEIVDDVEDNPFAKATGHVGTGRLVPKPKVSAADAETPSAEPEVTGPRKSGR